MVGVDERIEYKVGKTSHAEYNMDSTADNGWCKSNGNKVTDPDKTLGQNTTWKRQRNDLINFSFIINIII